MQFEGFKFSGSDLETATDKLDLHNCFDFAGFSYAVESRTLSLRWVPNEYAKPGEQRRLLVDIHAVSHLSCSPRDSAMPFTEDTCLSSIWQEPPAMHYVFEFISGFRINVSGEPATLTVE
jgi:hypothetical protein